MNLNDKFHFSCAEYWSSKKINSYNNKTHSIDKSIFLGRWPFDWRICNLWVTLDVLTCSSSILHMCFISVGRYLGIRNPLHARQANLFVSRRAVLWRIGIAWVASALIASPITMMSLYDHRNIVPASSECAISNKYFLIFGKFSWKKKKISSNIVF